MRDPNPVSDRAMRAAAYAQARDRFTRTGEPMHVYRQYRGEMQGGPLWHVRNTAEGEPVPSALIATIDARGHLVEFHPDRLPYTAEEVAQIQTLDEYRTALDRADWTYDKSDDPRVYREGQRTMSAFFAKAAPGTAWERLYNEAREQYAC